MVNSSRIKYIACTANAIIISQQAYIVHNTTFDHFHVFFFTLQKKTKINTDARTLRKTNEICTKFREFGMDKISKQENVHLTE